MLVLLGLLYYLYELVVAYWPWIVAFFVLSLSAWILLQYLQAQRRF